MSENKVPSVLNPFKDTYEKYLKAGFRGPLPIPYKDKFPPPVDFTGQRAPYPNAEDLQQWATDRKRHNICVRLAGVDEEHEILGIDVDDYIKGGKKKNGWNQLQVLEERLGELPNTWISSARVDGKSGIRYFRVPRGLAFRGQADKDIEIIRKGHRFAVVWPSIHPDGNTYWWFAPTTQDGKRVFPDREGRKIWDGVLPDARKLPFLPKSWIEYLTNGGTLAVDDEIIDVDSAVQEIYDWATDTFHKNTCHHPDSGADSDCVDCGDETQPCQLMKSKLEKHKKLIEDEATSHDKLTNAHWNLLHLAFEGHLGWNEAINELEAHFENITMGRGKRGLQEVQGEIFRSRIQALRQIKGKSDERLKISAKAVDALCTKVGICGSAANLRVVKDSQASSDDDSNDSNNSSDSDDPPDELDDVPQGALKAITDYRHNDDGNAEHLFDYFSTLETGSSFKWIEGFGWIVWHESENPHWEKDEFGNQIMRRMWHKVKFRQEDYASNCFDDWKAKVEDLLQGRNGITDVDVKIAKNVYDKANRWAEQSGNCSQSENAMKAAQSISGVSINVNSLDQNPLLLGVANGVVELDRQEVRKRKAQANDLITLNTNVAWEEPTQFAKDKWAEYLDTFLPDPELQKIVQIVLGHAIIGGNPEKIMVVLKGDPNTGKSTMIAALESALGDYCGTVSQTIFQNHKLNPVLANSLTKRIIVCSEFDEKDQLSASQVKRLTGGSDTIQAELKGSNVTIEGVPQFVPILATNEVPQISGADKALQNRLFVIPFNVTPRRVDKRFTNQIKSVCKEAVLNWLIEGFQEYIRIGELPVSNLIEIETQEFVNQIDHIATFKDECLIKVGTESHIRPMEIHNHYRIWCEQNSIQSRERASQPLLTRRLQSLGLPRSKKKINDISDNYFTNLKFRKKNDNVHPLHGTKGETK